MFIFYFIILLMPAYILPCAFFMFTFVEFPHRFQGMENGTSRQLYPCLEIPFPRPLQFVGSFSTGYSFFPFPSQRLQASSSQAPSTVSVYVAEVACYKLNFNASNFGVCSCHLFFQVSAFLLHHFSEVPDYSFTANMETEVVNISQFMVSVCFFVFSLCHSFRNLLKLAGQ